MLGRKTRVVAVASLLVAMTPLYAEAATAIGSGYMLTEEDFFAEIPKVITASRLVQPINEAPAALTVIDSEMIEASGARNLSDIFRLVPGFMVGYWSGNQQMVTYQGLGYAYVRQLQVIVDGRAVYIPSLGGVPWADIPLVVGEIKRIEITRGPNAVSYGSNSFLAVINIVTKKADDIANVVVKREVGSSETSDVEVHESFNTGKFKLRATAARQYDEGFEAFNDYRDANILNINSEYREDDGDRWGFYLGQSMSNQGRGGDTSLIDTAREVRTISNYQHVRWQSSQTKMGEWVFQGYRTYHSLEDEYTTDPIPFIAPSGVDINQTYASRRYDVELQNTVSPTAWLRLVWGGSYRQDR
ncbi:MAG: TonB-dependent receptor plug domain-containing protein, partial [Proteobacteria bacterium]|nr:TonB-dependent receptor plug domain-containing protein [Pseudomonadota bacterium]